MCLNFGQAILSGSENKIKIAEIMIDFCLTGKPVKTIPKLYDKL